MVQAVLYDFHGTLVNVQSIHPLLAAKKYEEFYAQSLRCPPIESTVLAARQSHEAGYRNVLFTGMSGNHEDGLRQWLDRHNVPVELIWMRTPGDFRKDFIVKREMYLKVLLAGYEILRAWEDNPRCVDLWERQGIPVVLVPGWSDTLMTSRVDNSTPPS